MRMRWNQDLTLRQYRVGELMMNDKDYKLARDCFSIVYDITQETQLKTLLDELDKDLEADNA